MKLCSASCMSRGSKYIVTPRAAVHQFIDTFKSDCMYCTAARAMILAFGIMLVPWFWPASIPAIRITLVAGAGRA